MMPLGSRERRPGCLSNLDLDELLAGDVADGAREARSRGHLDGCPDCAARLASFAAVEPPSPSMVLRAESRRGAPVLTRSRRQALAAFGLAACAAAGVLALGPFNPSSEERTKGGLALTIFVKRAGGAVDTVQGEGQLHAGDEMRFSLSTAAAGDAVVLGVDTAPSVTVYVPAPSDSATNGVRMEAAGVSALPGSVIADDTLGAERVFAVLCPTPRTSQSLRDLATAALARAGGRPEAVLSLNTGCLETSVLLHKLSQPR